jgi:hypothetical protein
LGPAFEPALLVQRFAQSFAPLNPDEAMRLQRTLGNHALGRLVQRRISNSPEPAPSGPDAATTVPPKLVLGPAGDRHEREAEQMAQHVLEMGGTVAGSPTDAVERRREEPQRQAWIQPAALNSRPGESGVSVPRGLETAIERARPAGRPLPDRVRDRMEEAFGADFDAVRIHADMQSDRLNRALQARAFTTGHDLFFRNGAYAPQGPEGQRLLAHELTHVVQQNSGSAGGVIQCLPTSNAVRGQLGEPDDGLFGSTKYKPVLRSLDEYDQIVRNQNVSLTGLPDLMKSYDGVENTARNYVTKKGPEADTNPTKLAYMGNLIGKVAVERIQAHTAAERADTVYSHLPRQKWIIGLTSPKYTGPAITSKMVHVSAIKESKIKGAAKGGTNEVAKVKIGDEIRYFKADKTDLPLAGLIDLYTSEHDIENISQLAELQETRWETMKPQEIANEYNVPAYAGIIKERKLPDLPKPVKDKVQNRQNKAKYKQELEDLRTQTGFVEKQDLHLAQRDVAMSRLDQLLNVGIIADAELALRKIGKGKSATFVKGSLMAGATGEQAGKLTWAALKESGELQRLLSRLQLLDAIAYQVDRNLGNIFIQTDDNGNVIALKGIDNDMSFGQYKTDVTQPIQEYPGISSVVDEELAESIIKLQAQDLQNAMLGLLTDAEIDAAVTRLQQLQGHLKKLKADGKLVKQNQWGKDTARLLLKEKTNYYSTLESKLPKS